MIEVDKLSRDFGTFRAVDQVSFQVQPGEVLGFLGPNGAGKSTTMKMLTGYLKPSSGDAHICGFSISKHPIQARTQLGYLPESAPSYQEMQVEEFLRFTGEVRGLRGKDLASHLEAALEKTSLTEVRHQLIDTLSKGFRQRTCLAQALLHNPPVLLLDEPTDGLDPNQKHEVRQLIKNLRHEHSILVSTHILEEVEAICTRALILAQGRLVGNGTPEELLSQSRYHNALRLHLQTENSASMISELKAMAEVDQVKILHQEGSNLHLQVLSKDRFPLLDVVLPKLQMGDVTIKECYVERGRLDEVFRNLTMPEAS